MTDSNSGITKSEAKELGIFSLPMPVIIDGEICYEGIDLTQERFYSSLTGGKDVTTSQPSPGEVIGMWDAIFAEGYDEIVHIPMSSGLSNSYESAAGLAADYDGRVQVADNHRISVTLRESVLEAKELADQGLTAEEIREELERRAYESCIYITVDTLKYLKKGGRVTPAAAAIGTVLNLKPVLQIQGEKLDSYAKVRGWKAAKKAMLDAAHKDLEGRFKGKEVSIQAAYTCSDEEAAVWKAEIEEHFPGYPVHMDRLSLSVSCHIGSGSKAIACIKKADY